MIRDESQVKQQMYIAEENSNKREMIVTLLL